MIMKKLSIGAGCQCRVWSNEAPQIIFTPDISETHLVENPDLAAGVPFLAAVELFIPRGARIVYGALVVEYLPDAIKNQLEIEVAIKEGLDFRWSDSLAASLDEVYIGLPSEYTEAIFSGASKALEQSNCRLSGKLKFSGGAHGYVSSNNNVFKELAYWAVSSQGDIARMSEVDGLRNTML
jgi:hypothetical protein